MFRLLTNFARGRRAAVFDAALSVPGRVYAIGDVHGSALLLERLVGRIASECEADGIDAQLVLLGDYVDRGEDTRAVLDVLASLGERPCLRPVLLRGNHEEMLLDVVDRGAGVASWLRFGGLQTLLSYGVPLPSGLGSSGDPVAEQELREALAGRMGAHLDLLRGLGLGHRAGNVFFSHAGADPDLDLSDQPDAALVWGAPSFLERTRGDGLWVVHGHYVTDAPGMAAGRISIDTGAYFSGRLTAVRLEGQAASFMVENGAG